MLALFLLRLASEMLAKTTDLATILRGTSNGDGNPNQGKTLQESSAREGRLGVERQTPAGLSVIEHDVDNQPSRSLFQPPLRCGDADESDGSFSVVVLAQLLDVHGTPHGDTETAFLGCGTCRVELRLDDTKVEQSAPVIATWLAYLCTMSFHSRRSIL